MDAVNRCGYAALAGRPNVGKSTLLNRLIGQKIAITSHKAQTTRHALMGIRSLDGGQILYVDTPGLHLRGGSALNRMLNRTAENVLAGVDVVLLVVQALAWTTEDGAALQALRKAGVPVVLVVNKTDLVSPREKLLPYLAEAGDRYPFDAVLPVSAKRGDNLDELERVVLQHLPVSENLFPSDQVTDRSERFLAAELLREQLTRRYAAELPYALTVEIERFEEDEGLYRIGAVIWVEKPGQKAILIGKGGEAMKETSRLARESMEKLFQNKVWLDVWVKVRKSWSSDERALNQFGYLE
jgi:GTP-binding protein Era